MSKIKLTKTTVEKLPFADKGKQIDYYDTELDGFGVRISATAKKYFVRSHIGNRRVRVMMKSFKLISAEEARKEALVKLGLMAQGYTPYESCLIGVFIHGLAGDLAAEKWGFEALNAPNISHYLGKAFNKLKPRTD